MGQYYYVVNVDKKQYLNPHAFGDGLKLMEFGLSGCGTMAGLAVLLAQGNGRGLGDLHSEDPLVGSWAGDRVIVAGDYADAWVDPQDLSSAQEGQEVNLYQLAEVAYEDISTRVVEALRQDSYLNREMKPAWA